MNNGNFIFVLSFVMGIFLCCGYVLVSIYVIIKSPRYTGGDFMFLYQFVRRRRHRRRQPQILV